VKNAHCVTIGRGDNMECPTTLASAGCPEGQQVAAVAVVTFFLAGKMENAATPEAPPLSPNQVHFQDRGEGIEGGFLLGVGGRWN
jgi:hypothetical protein